MNFFYTWVLLLSFFYTWDITTDHFLHHRFCYCLTHWPLAFILPSFTHGALLFTRFSLLIHGPWTVSHSCCRQSGTAEPAILWTHKYALISLFHVSVVSHFRHYKFTAYRCTRKYIPIKDLGVLSSFLPSASHAGKSASMYIS